MKRALFLMLVLPVALAGCGLFGGGDDGEKKPEEQQQQTSYMAGASAAAPGESEKPSPALPLASLIVSGLTMLGLVIHVARRRPGEKPLA